MIRDFSEAVEQELYSSMDGIRSDNWITTPSWFTDWGSYQSIAAKTYTTPYFETITSYHQRVIDKCQESKEKAFTIFHEARSVDSTYGFRLAIASIRLNHLKTLLATTANMISPENGCAFSEEWATQMSDLYNSILGQNPVVNQLLSEDGLTEDEISALDPTSLRRTLEDLGSLIIALTPNIKVGQELEVPIGPGLVVYYKNEVEGDFNSPITIETTLEDHKLKLDKFNIASEGKLLNSGVDINDGEIDGVSIGGRDANVKMTPFGAEMENSYTVGNNTYTVKIEVGIDEVVFEESVCTDVEGGSITSAIGIKKKPVDGWVPIPVEVEVPVNITVPDALEVPVIADDHISVDNPNVTVPAFDVDWKAVGEGALVVVGTVVVAGAVIYFAPVIGSAFASGGWVLLPLTI